MEAVQSKKLKDLVSKCRGTVKKNGCLCMRCNLPKFSNILFCIKTGFGNSLHLLLSEEIFQLKINCITSTTEAHVSSPKGDKKVPNRRPIKKWHK